MKIRSGCCQKHASNQHHSGIWMVGRQKERVRKWNCVSFFDDDLHFFGKAQHLRLKMRINKKGSDVSRWIHRCRLEQIPQVLKETILK